MRVLKVLKEAATPAALVFLVLLTVYNNTGSRSNPAPAPPEPRSEPVVVQMGKDYGRALVEAAANTLEASASRPWTSTSKGVQQNLDDFDVRLAKAWKPVANELTRRFGSTSDQPIDPAQEANLRQFCRDLSTGLHKEAKP
jgi:hypothetical protein